ncbi:MAG: site-2 protease family protein [Actinomycetes bacterium]
MNRSESGVSLGSPFGIPLRLSSTWFIGAAIIAWLFAPSAERWLAVEPPWSWVVAASFAVLLGLSVLAHELSHAVVAQRFGLRVRSMTLHLLGGVTLMDAENRRPWVDFVIAAVGPITSLVVGGVAWLGYLAAPPHTVFSFVTWQLTAANIAVGVFNLVPALPLDGGRLLRDVVWAASGRENLGTVVAGWTGRVFAVIVALTAVVPVLLGSPDVVWLGWGLLLSVFIWVEASRSLAGAKAMRAASSLTVQSLMRPGITMRHDTPLSVAIAQLPDPRTAILVAGGDGRVSGVVNPEAADAVPVERRPWVPIASVAVTVAADQRIEPTSNGMELIDALNLRPAPVHLVGDADGTVYGVLVTADVEATLSR